MRYFSLFIISIFTFVSCESNSNNDKSIENAEVESLPKYSFTNFEQKISYCIGLDHGTSSRMFLNSENFIGKFNLKDVEKGMIDYLKGTDLRIMPYEVDSVLNLYLVDNGQVDSSIVSSADGSFAYGISEAQVLVASLVSRGIDQTMVVDLLTAGIEDGMEGHTPSVPLKDARIEVVAYYSGINKDAGEQFLAQNIEREGVLGTKSGLQYQVFEKGNGIKPTGIDTVLVHYTGRFIDGREFESTIPSMIPAKFTPLGLIPGFAEGLQLMNEGAKYRFFMPYQLAYGEKGSAGIEPYSALVFDVELLKVTKFVPNY